MIRSCKPFDHGSNQPRLWFWLCAAAALLWASPARADVLGDLAGQYVGALESGSYAFALLLVFGAGVATAFTPCVYPMIAITVSVFGARQTSSRSRGALLSTAFVLGIAALFTPLGVISALTGDALGSALANSWVLLGIGLLFGAMALSMFGAFDLALPPALQNRMAQVGGSGYRGAFGVGFVSGLVAAPCTGPVLTVLLTWVGTTGNVGFGALSLFAYSLGLGVLFWVVGTFAVTLPKSGRWLEWVKSVFGVVMLALAVHYLRPILALPAPAVRTTPWLGAAIACLILGIAVGAIHLSFKEGPVIQRVRKGLGITLAVGGIWGSVAWMEALPAGVSIAWMNDYPAAQQMAKERAKPMLVDFGADWCGACKELERGALSDPRVIAEARRFVAVRVDLSADRATPEKWALLSSYQQPGLPLIVLHDDRGKESSRVTGPTTADRFLELMKAVP